MEQIPAPVNASIPKNNNLAVTSLVLGIIAIPAYFCYGFGILFAIAAIVTGFIARSQIKSSNGQQTGNGMALAGIIIGFILMLLVVCAVLVIAVLSLMGPSIGDVFNQINSGLGAP
jgi:hypothetical protein